MIRGVRKIVVPVDDQDSAKEFWVDRIGFAVVKDELHDGTRWLEVTPPDGSAVLVLSARSRGDRRLEVSDQLPHANVVFTCDDIEATHRELIERGVRFHTAPAEQPFGRWSLFEDPAGTRYALAQYSRSAEPGRDAARPVERFTTLFRASLAADLACDD